MPRGPQLSQFAIDLEITKKINYILLLSSSKWNAVKAFDSLGIIKKNLKDLNFFKVG